MFKASRRHPVKLSGTFRGSRWRRLMLFTVLLIVGSAVPVLAELPSGEVIVASEDQAKVLPGATDVTEGLREAEEREAEEQRLRETSEAEEERAASTNTYADLTAAQAEALLLEKFAEQWALIDRDPARALSDARLLQALGPDTALVTVGGDTMLVEGQTPIRVTDEEGDLTKVDLDLERETGGYVLKSPITNVTFPDDASQPIGIGDEGFAISPILSEPSSSARPINGEDVQYFETQKDSDLIVSPLAAGAEFFSLLRSANSPEELGFEITLPAGAELGADGEGGAEVTREGDRLIRIPAPRAFDAQGTDVPVSMRVERTSLILAIAHRSLDVAYPLLVDPEVVQENWYDNGNDWYHYGNLWALEPGTSPWIWNTNNGGRFLAGTTPIYANPGLSERGLFVSATSTSGSQAANQFGQFTITSPGSDSYFTAALINPFWRWDHGCGYQTYPEPHDYSGLWSETWGWATFHSNWARLYGYGIEAPFEELQGTPDEWRAKTGHVLVIGMGTGNGGAKIPCWRDLYAGGVNLWMDDWGQPVLTTSSTEQWMDNVPIRLNVSASDAGLGVRKFESEATNKSGGAQTWETWNSCTGGFAAPCPAGWNLAEASQPQLSYDPSVLPEGIDTLNVTAYDATLKKSTTTNGMTVRVDHAAPTITLSGTLTEQSTLGTELPKYTIRADAEDGVPGSEKSEDARSGVASIVIENDGQVVDEYAPGCPTQSCSAYDELEVPAAELTPGSHVLSVTATDAIGHTSEPVELNYTTGDKQPPTLDVTGLPAEATSNPVGASYWSTFGAFGTGDGQLNRPADVAVGSNGEVWVVDKINGRIQQFDAEGKFQFKFGAKGSGDGQLSLPAALAIDAQGDLWVADGGNRRVQKFSPEGEYLDKFGSQGTGNGQFSSYGPRGIAIDAQGNIWVSDYSERVQKFNANGEFIEVVGAGLFGESASLDIEEGKVWIADWAFNKVRVFSEAGESLFTFGSAGAGDGQFSRPDAIDVDAQGNVWVGDEGNSRVQQFDQAGEYVAQFGSNGSGEGQFKFAWPFGLAADDRGSLWIADSNNHRVQRWLAPTTTVSGYLEPISTTATDGGFGVTSVAVELTDQSLSTEVLDEAAQTCPEGGCQLSLDPEDIDLSEQPTGPYILSVVAEDGAGNVSETSRALNLDPAPPEITLSGELAEGAGAPLSAPSADLEIAASDVDPASGGVTTINVERDDQLVASYPSDCSSDCHEVEASYTFQANEDGAKRSIQTVASPEEGAIGELRRASCAAMENCWAVGRTKHTPGEQEEGKVAVPLLEHWDGEEWQTVTVPKPEGATDVFLEGVSCGSASACMAVGYYTDGEGHSHPLAERWNGTEWAASSPALPSGASKGSLYGVSCNSATSCWAYGETQVTSAEQEEGKTPVSYVVRWVIVAWGGVMTTPKPEGATDVFLEGISCNAIKVCMAVGYYTDGEGHSHPLAERWNGTEWAASSPALPSGASKGSLYGVSCNSATSCWAYGETQVTSAEQEEGQVPIPYFARWDGSAWQAEAVPKTPSGSEVALTAVACASESACTAVGRYDNGHSETSPLAYTWNGSEWRFQPVPTPAETTGASLEGVSCTSANECAMVGYSQEESGEWRVLAETEAPGQGPYQITVEAVDAQGNSESETIEVDVSNIPIKPLECDPEVATVASKDVLSTGQAIDVIEESLPAAVAPSEGMIDEITEEEVDPSYSLPSPNLDAIDSLAEGETSVTPEGGFTLDETACFTPAVLTSAATEATVVNEDAAVFANTAPEADTVIRPTAIGVTVIQSLRGPEVPESFSWNVTVAPGNELIELPSGAVAVVDPNSEESEGTAEAPPQPETVPQALPDAEAQLEDGEYQLISASHETSAEVVAVIAQPWVVLAQGGIVPALIEVVPDTETTNEFEVVVSVPEFDPEEQWEEKSAMLVATASTASSLSGHCPSGQSPCGKFDFNRAAKYAKYWGNEKHQGGWNWDHYPDWGSTNCTNFTSQVLRAGRAKFMRTLDKGDGSWWYRNLVPNGQLYWNGHDQTQSWIVADVLPRHLWQYGLAHIDPVNQPWGWTTGNILAYDWFGENGKGNFDHLNFVVGRIKPSNGPYEPLIANSSSPGHRYGSKRWSRVREAIQEAEGGDGWTRVPLAVKHTKADRNEKKHTPENLYDSNGVFRG